MVNGGVPEGSMARSPGALIAPALARGRCWSLPHPNLRLTDAPELDTTE